MEAMSLPGDLRSRGRSNMADAAGDEEEDQCVFLCLRSRPAWRARRQRSLDWAADGRLQVAEAPVAFLGAWLETEMPRKPLRRFMRRAGCPAWGGGLAQRMTKIACSWKALICWGRCHPATAGAGCAFKAQTAVEGRGDIAGLNGAFENFSSVVCRVSNAVTDRGHYSV